MTVNAGAGQEGGTPFTQVGVRELRRLGILTMVIPDRVCSWGRSCTGDFNWIYKAVNQAAFN